MGAKDGKVPGPGAYTATNGINTGTGKSFGRESQRAKRAKNGAPGPGQYAPKTSLQSSGAPRYGFGSATRSGLRNSSGTPGPGNYNINGHYTKNTAPRGLLVPRRPDSAPVKGRNTPGPGAYNSSMKDKHSSPNYGFGTGPKSPALNKDKTPGAGAYNPNGSHLLKSPGFGIGTAT